MSSWLVATMRGKPASEYDYTMGESIDTWDATADIAATANAHKSVHKLTTWNGHVYAYIRPSEWPTGEEVLAVVGHALRDAVLLHANDTTDAGTARYYTSPEYYSHEYAETGHGTVGHEAMGVMTAMHGIIPRDPFHTVGRIDDNYLEDGRVFEDGKVVKNA